MAYVGSGGTGRSEVRPAVGRRGFRAEGATMAMVMFFRARAAAVFATAAARVAATAAAAEPGRGPFSH